MARAYLDVLTDDVALWAIPGSKLDLYAERIAVLAKANAVLTTFHQVRRKDVEDGKSPTIKDRWQRWRAGTRLNRGRPERVRALANTLQSENLASSR